MEFVKTDNAVMTTAGTTSSSEDATYFIESIRHSGVAPTFIATCLIKLCDSKTNCTEEMLIKFANNVVENLICESPLTEILRTLDSTEFSKKISMLQQFDFNKFLFVCRYLCSSDKQGLDILGITFFSKVWKSNAHFQQQVIRYCIVSDWVQQILNNCKHPSLTKKVPQIENLKCPIEYETDCQIYCWKYQCLCQILLDLSDINQLTRSFVEEIFFTPLNKCPDLLVFSLIECHGNHGLKENVLIKALLKFICVSHNNPNPNATLIIQKIWPTDFVYTPKIILTWAQKSLLTAMVELYTSSSPEEQSYKLSKILDLSQDLKVLNVLLSSNTYSFVIDLACFASRREYLKLDKWLNDKITQNGPQFVDACIQFLKKRCAIFGATEPTTSLPNETYRIILNCLRHHVSDTPKSMIEFEIIKMYNKFTQWVNQNQFVNSQLPTTMKPSQFDSVGSHLFPENPIRSPQLNATQQPYSPETEEEFTKDIEEEADSYFQRIYNQDQPDSLTIDQFLDMLKKFQESSHKREKEIAACMIRNLFKEYPFLPQYPDKELVITGEIFGGIILNNLVKGLTMVNALRCVMDALKRTESSSRYFMFGQAALNKLKTRLKEFPQFCNHLCNIPTYRDLPPILIEFIEYARQGTDPPSLTHNRRITLLNSNNKMNAGNNQASNDAQCQQVEIPPSAFQDKVAFIINNLSQMNLVKKADEFKELFLKEKDQYFQWFSHYFVMKRVGLESNYHELYATFMVKVSTSDLSVKILSETYRNIKILLRSNKETDNFQDRTLLKNLGNWLGIITLSQNKPILTINLDLRNLLIEAYHKGQLQMLFVVPFVTKILMGSAKSKVFRPPCPWTVKLIKILVELHSVSNLKLNLKFEVEVLCKHLELKIEDFMGKSQDLKNKELFMKLEPQLGASSMPRPNFVPNNIGSVLEPNVAISGMLHSSHSTVDSNSMHPQTAVSNTVTATTNQVQNYNEINVNNISNLSQSIVIQPNLQIIMLNPQHKNFIRNLIEKCVQEWITFVSERVIKVCMVTTETLVKKDFVHESNAELMRNAAHKMMRSLVAGYSLINTQEPLLNRIQMSLLTYFQAKPMMNVTKELIDSTIQRLINDNLELCVCFVQKTCIERAIEELDKRMKPDFEARQKITADGNKKSSSISLKQLQIYEEMGRNIAGFSTNQSSFYTPMDNTPAKTANYPSVNVLSASSHNYPLVHNEHNAMNVQGNQVHVDAFVVIYDKLIKHLSELIQEFEYVHYTTEAMHQVLEILKVCKQNPRDQATAVSLIKNVINGLRELLLNAETGVTDLAVISRARDFYLILLKALADQRAYNLRFTTLNVTRSVLEHWIAMNTTFPDDLFDILNRQELINLNFLDNEFYQILENGSTSFPMILNFLKYYLGNISANHFPTTLDLLQRIVAMKMNQQSPTNTQLIIELKHILSLARINIPNQSNNEMMDGSALETIVKDWIRYYNSKDINNSFPVVVKNMNAQGILKNDESIANFFKFFLEFCVERCYQIISYAVQHPTFPLNNIHLKCYELIDSYSVLVILFIKQSGNQGNLDQKFQFLIRILTILTNTAYRDQEIHHKDFFSLTYYRIMLSIFIEFFYSPLNFGFQELIVSNDNLFEVFKFHLVRNYCNFLHQMCPSKMPSFTFAWLDFISHRIFMGKCLDNSHQINHKTWPIYCALLTDLLLFLKPILQNMDSFIVNTNMELYKGTLKLFLILFHDFPEFLCEYCYNLCDIIPIRAVQLRNIILSANPINIPDVSNLKVDNLYEIIPPVRISSTILCDQLQYFQKELESYLLHRTPSNFLTDLAQALSANLLNAEKQSSFTTLINALTLYIGISAIQTNKSVTINSIHNSVHLEIFQHLLMNFDSQGRYILINSMVDHLRYPNNETLLFICLLLTLFKENNEHIREQIVRVLLERYITQRPHPWGIEYLINELFRNPNYKLLEHNFIKCVPEIEKYFSRST
ncbi:ccr4-not transcription complex subunit 1-like protein [Dermatophagoides farinae]|uniref:Ccr4-not transcription complex subunit 1-like protein n=1 Tax=Dermatophagoides farinae TaxID=6954 RepID=A0A9D4P1L2_DERFA|nr:ccr4-not transcription complex subunit 1-like protein [Dermatophagoides farinae]